MADLDSSSSSPPDTQYREKCPVASSDYKHADQLTSNDVRSATTTMSMSGDHTGESTPPSIIIGPAGDASARRMTSGLDSPRSVSMDSPRATDCQSVDTRLSGVSGESCRGSQTDSQPASARGRSSTSPHKGKDPARREKEKEREERVRITRERMEQERKRKFEELKEQQRIAQENRERQLELRRHKMEEMRRREIERRMAVEDRRRQQEEQERLRRETIVQKSQQRVARYEQWKNSGRSGPCPWAVNPPSRHMSVSTSVLYHKRNSDFASSGTLSNRPESVLALNTIPEGRRSFLASATTATTPTRPKSSAPLNAGAVKLRESKPPRKPRPASVATSMPTFVVVENQTARSKSTDRVSRADRPERSRAKLTRKSLPATPTQAAGGRDDNKENSETSEENKSTGSGGRVNRHTFERLSTPKHVRGKPEKTEQKPDVSKSTSRLSRQPAPRKAYSTTNLSTVARKPIVKQTHEKQKVRESKPATAATPSAPEPAVKVPTPAAAVMSMSVDDSTAAVTVSDSGVAGKSTDSMSKSMSDVSKSATSSSNQDILEYKAKLAEHRRLAREKAERAQELERQRLEQERLVEEERQRQEEEEQRRQEEEILRLAEEARRAEEERLAAAIAAEEQRRREEAERLDAERKARQEAEQKAREEAERLEKERQERKIREEEERLERKKRLEMIMKRVKTDGSESPKNQSPAKSVNSSPSKSGDSSTESSADDAAEETMTTVVTTSGASTTITTMMTSEEKPSSRVSSPVQPAQLVDKTVESVSAPSVSASSVRTPGVSTPKFHSPLLQHLVESKSSENLSTEQPKFKSPILQSLLGKNKQKKGEEKSVVFALDREVLPPARELSRSLEGDLSKTHDVKDEDKDVDTTEGLCKHIPEQLPSDGENKIHIESEQVFSTEAKDSEMSDIEHKESEMSNIEHKESEMSDIELKHSEMSNIEHKDSEMSNIEHKDSEMIEVDNKFSDMFQVEKKGGETSLSEQTDNRKSDEQTKEAVGNGVREFDPFSDLVMLTSSNLTDEDKTMKSGTDSGILVDLGTSASSLTAMNGITHNGVFHSSQELVDSSISLKSVDSVCTSDTVTHGNDFEEIIDLSVSNKTVQLKTQEQGNKGDNCDDLLKLNNCEESSPTPFIAFEEKTSSRQDIPDLLS